MRINKRAVIVVTSLASSIVSFCWAGNPALQKFLGSSRREMVDELKTRSIENPEVLKAMSAIPREMFVPKRIANRTLAGHAYDDKPIEIEYNRSIPTPYLVAYTAQAASGESSAKVLEVGTGSGYQTAVLSKIYKDVYTTELVKPLTKEATKVFKRLKLTNVHMKETDGYSGWKENGPYDAIIVNASLDEPSPALIKQLKPGGVMLVPIGATEQMLTKFTKKEKGYKSEKLIAVKFSPLTRETPVLPPPPPPDM